MISFLTAYALLLVPIIVLLIVRVRRRQRVVYTHTFLQALHDRPFQEFLLRTLQLYYDVVADMVLALLLALILSGILDFSPRRVAVCLDGSFSMVQGGSDSPLNRALVLLSEGGLSFERCRLFAAGFDPESGRYKLYRLGRYGSGSGSVETLRNRVASLPGFFSADPRSAAELFQRGYRRVVFLTDRYAGPRYGLEVRELGASSTAQGEAAGFFYPLSAGYREEERSFRLGIYRHRFSEPIHLERFAEEKGAFAPLQTIGPEADATVVSEIQLEEEGLYRLSRAGLDFLLPLYRPVYHVRAEGPFSTLLAEVLPGVQPGADGIVLADVPWKAEDPGSLNRLIRRRRGILTVIPAANAGNDLTLEPYLFPFRDSLSQPAYTGLPSGFPIVRGSATGPIFLDPRRLRDPEIPIVYMSALWSLRPPGPLVRPGGLTRGARLSLERSGVTSFAYAGSEGVEIINLPPEEFFPLSAPEATAGIGSAGPSSARPLHVRLPARIFAALLLALAYLAKLLYLVRLHGRSLILSR
jgi:hypothetical protein